MMTPPTPYPTPLLAPPLSPLDSQRAPLLA